MDISDLKKSITEARRQIASINSSFNEVAGNTSKWEHSTDLLERKLKQLKDLIEENNKLIQYHSAIIQKSQDDYDKNNAELNEYQEQLKKLKKAHMENSDKYDELSRKIDVCRSNMLDAEVTMKNSTTTVNNLKGRIVDLNRDIDDYAEELEDARIQEEYQQTSLGKLEKLIKDQTEALSDLKAEYKNVILEQGENSDSAKELAGKIDFLSDELNTNKQKLKDADEAAQDLDKSIDDAGESADHAANNGFTVLKGVIVNLVTDAIHKCEDALRDLIDTSIEFESTFADVRKVLGDVSDDEMKELEHGIRDLAKVRPQTASDINEITAMAAQLGIRGNDNLLAFTDTMIKLGDSTNLTGQEAAETLAKFMNITGTAQKDVGRLGATIVNLGNNFATTERDISDMALRLGGAGEMAGMTEPEILAVAAALTSVGINAEAGGSAFSKLIINMSNASANGEYANKIISETGMSLRDLQMLSDSDSAAFKEMAQSLGYTSEEFQDFVDASATLEKFSEVTGMTSEEFTKAFGDDALGTIQLFIGALSEMSGTDALVTLDEMGIKEIRLRDAILRATTGVDNFNSAIEVANQGWEENVALDNEANQRYQTTAARIQMVKNKFTDLGIEAKERLQPAIDKLIDAFDDLVDGLKWLMDVGVPKFFEWMRNEGKPLTGIVVGLAAGFAAFMIMQTIQAITIKLTMALKALFLVMSANPIMLVISAITALVAAFLYFWNTSAEFRQFWYDLWDGIKNIAQTTWDAITGFFTDAWDAIVLTWNSAVAFFEELWSGIKNVLSGVAKWVYDNVIQPVIKFFDPLWKFLSTLTSNIVGLFTGTWDLIKHVWKFVPSWFEGIVIKPVREFFETLFETIKSVASDAWDNIVLVWNVVSSWFRDNVTEPIETFFSTIWNTVKSGASDAWEGIKEIFSPVAHWFRDKFSVAWESVKNVFSTGGKVFDGIKDGILDGLKVIINALIEGINTVIAIPFRGINKALRTIRDISILGYEPFKDKISEFEIPRIPTLQRGGVLRKGQVGFLEGNGAEAVVPLENNKAWIRAVAKDMRKEFGASGSSLNAKMNPANNNNVTNFTQIINAPKQPSRIELYRQTRNLLNFSRGGT